MVVTSLKLGNCTFEADTNTESHKPLILAKEIKELTWVHQCKGVFWKNSVRPHVRELLLFNCGQNNPAKELVE
jgi:hypothetical protein